MTCPRCSARLESAGSTCAECGLGLFRNVSGIVKTSIVLISTGDDNAFYPSVRDVPEPLRRQLLESTSGGNAGTIVIADRAGKEQLTQGIARRLENTIESASRAINEAPAKSPSAVSAAVARSQRQGTWIAWAGLLAVLTLAALFALLFGMRW